MNNEEKIKEIVKRIKDLSNQRANLLNTINAQHFMEELVLYDSSSPEDLMLIKKALKLEIEVLTTDQEMI